ncbi:3-deoxy-7-phosphoheptulonate synthase [Candidatus Cyanaurora vandensis]|uniref:3-deoxy-7-phosphoheptulonate synthase n=1 Tax=Candidatus Cyanaurora vandensis TaxID=2714958 RepID=UPI00257A1343|nr:3-deoxy-7-phosphoheptulonate synthase [Candidatus Cyanaurora vandensis]
MIIVLKPGTPREILDEIVQTVTQWSLEPHVSVGSAHVVIGLIGDTRIVSESQCYGLSPFVERVMRVEKRFKRASREFHPEPTTITVRGIPLGADHPVFTIAGPCSVESEAMIIETALAVKAAGAQFLRGGAFKPRTSPYEFQGHGESALELLAAARAASGLGIITEVMDTADIDMVAAVADVLQVGARNMQNYALLKKLGQVDKPILLKRGFSSSINEWLLAAEYILAAGNPNVLLCERGIRSFDQQYTRNVLDLSAIPVLRTLTHLPIVVDPAHATGKAQFVKSMSLAAVAAGCDGLMVEVHPTPAKALSDGAQSLTPEQFQELMGAVSHLATVFERGPRTLSTV